jgi:hypothetical protein
MVTLSQAALINGGIRLFMAPDVKDVEELDGYTTKIDIWSWEQPCTTKYARICKDVGAINFTLEQSPVGGR